MDAINSYIEYSLKDPSSRQLKDATTPTPSFISRRVITKSPSLFDVNGYITEIRDRFWLVSILVNAKNGYGGYVGWQKYDFYFDGERMVKAVNRTAEADEADRAFQAIMHNR